MCNMVERVRCEFEPLLRKRLVLHISIHGKNDGKELNKVMGMIDIYCTEHKIY